MTESTSEKPSDTINLSTKDQSESINNTVTKETTETTENLNSLAKPQESRDMDSNTLDNNPKEDCGEEIEN